MIKKTTTMKKQMLEVMVEYTDSFLIPLLDDRFAISREEFKEEIGALRYELKDYVDKKLADQTSDIFKRLDRRDQKNIKFKQKVVTVFKDNDMVTSKDLTYLSGLATS